MPGTFTEISGWPLLWLPFVKLCLFSVETGTFTLCILVNKIENVLCVGDLWILRDDLLHEGAWQSPAAVACPPPLALLRQQVVELSEQEKNGHWVRCKIKSPTSSHDNLQDFPHFLSSGRTLNDWNHSLPHLIFYPIQCYFIPYNVRLVHSSYETTCICNQARCQGPRALCLIPPSSLRDM